MTPAIGPDGAAIRVDPAAIGPDPGANEIVRAAKQVGRAAKQVSRAAIRVDPAAIGLDGRTIRAGRAANESVRGGIEPDGAVNGRPIGIPTGPARKRLDPLAGFLLLPEP